LIVRKAQPRAPEFHESQEANMDQHWFVWLAVSALGAFGFVLGAVALFTRGE
jgi:hypothetical protein